MEEEAPPSRGSIKLLCTWSRVLRVVTGHHQTRRASTQGLPVSPSAGEVAPGSSHPTFPAPKSGSWGPTRLDPLERTQPRTCCSHPLFSGIWSLVPGSSRREVPEDPHAPRPWASTVTEASPPLQYLSFFRTTDSERTAHPTSSGSLTASLLSSRLQPQGTEKGEEAAVQFFPTYPWVRRQEGHTAALTTCTPLGIGINREGKGPWISPHLCLFPEDLGQGAKCLLD